MTREQIIEVLEAAREIIIWNDIEDYDLPDEAREKICIDLEDAVEQMKAGD